MKEIISLRRQREEDGAEHERLTASGLVTSVPAVAPAVAALGDGDTRVVLAAEFAGLTWFHCIQSNNTKQS